MSSPFQQAKLLLVEHLYLAKDALHIYVAITVFVGCCLLFGWKASQFRPLLVVLGVAFAGELWDLRDELVYSEPVAPFEHIKDILNTLAVPSLLLILSRHSQMLR